MSHSVDERYDVYCETLRCAAKEHACSACREVIPKGDRYYTIAIVFYGVESLKRCLRCQKLHEHLRTLGDSDTWPDERLNCGQDYEEEWGKLPEEIAMLAFVSGHDLQPTPAASTESRER